MSAAQDLLVVPSTNAIPFTLASIPGVESWPERHLIELRHLQHPEHRVFMVTDVPISDVCLDAVLHLLPVAPANWCQQRLRCISLNDHSARGLTTNLLERPRLLNQLGDQLRPGAVLGRHAVSEAEMSLAERLSLQLEGSPAAPAELGSKAGSAAAFRALGFPQTRSRALCRSLEERIEAIEALVLRHRDIQQVVVKLNRMAGGRGNAPLPLSLPRWRQLSPPRRVRKLRCALEHLAIPLAHWQEEMQRHCTVA